MNIPWKNPVGYYDGTDLIPTRQTIKKGGNGETKTITTTDFKTVKEIYRRQLEGTKGMEKAIVIRIIKTKTRPENNNSNALKRLFQELGI